MAILEARICLHRYLHTRYCCKGQPQIGPGYLFWCAFLQTFQICEQNIIYNDDLIEANCCNVETAKEINGSDLRLGSWEVKFKSDRRTVLIWKGCEISLKGFATNIHPYLTQITMDTKKALASYRTKHLSDEVSKKKLLQSLSDHELLIVKSKTIWADHGIIIKLFSHDRTIIKKPVPLTMQYNKFGKVNHFKRQD